MAGPAPKTRKWSARENKHKPSGLHVIVTGEVEVSATNKHPHLTEGPHVGKVLPLDLTISESGVGAPLVVWMAAYFHREVSANEFDRVDIRWDGKVIATVPVIDDTEYDALCAKQAQVQNGVTKVKTKKAAPKKAAPKKAAAVKTVAKKSAKKVAKKAPKKKTAKKKAAPKSAFKKFVKKLVKKLTPKKAPKKKTKKSKKRR